VAIRYALRGISSRPSTTVAKQRRPKGRVLITATRQILSSASRTALIY
jgi:hypothetical protein